MHRSIMRPDQIKPVVGREQHQTRPYSYRAHTHTETHAAARAHTVTPAAMMPTPVPTSRSSHLPPTTAAAGGPVVHPDRITRLRLQKTHCLQTTRQTNATNTTNNLPPPSHLSSSASSFPLATAFFDRWLAVGGLA